MENLSEAEKVFAVVFAVIAWACLFGLLWVFLQ